MGKGADLSLVENVDKVSSVTISNIHKTIAVAVIFLGSFGSASALDQEALEAQASSALASVDFARERCSMLRVQDAAVEKLITRTGKTRAYLVAHEDYVDQASVLLSVSKDSGLAMSCNALLTLYGPGASGSLRRGLLSQR